MYGIESRLSERCPGNIMFAWLGFLRELAYHCVVDCIDLYRCERLRHCMAVGLFHFDFIDK